MQRLTTGYPRFVYNAHCRRLFGEGAARFAADGESCLVFPSRRTAAACAEFIERRAQCQSRLHELPGHDVWAVVFPVAAAPAAKAFWQHTGVGVSSRQAEAVLEGRRPVDATSAQSAIRQRLSGVMGVPQEAVTLFPTGMAAFHTLHQAVAALFPGRKSVQFGFPYVDSLKVLEGFGAGAHFFPRGDEADVRALEDLVRSTQVSAICTEFPANPLLTSPDLSRLAEIARRAGVPLIVDDTVASCVNVDLLPVADVVWCSLTKYFSGRGDVTGGAAVVNPRSPFADRLTSALAAEYEDLLWCDDAVVLEANSRDFSERVHAVNRTAETLAAFLQQHPDVAAVHYPAYRSRGEYAAFQRSGGGFGGLLSLEVRNPEQCAPRFYDALAVCKGPNLGMSYTLACPFTILAHYHELDFAERCGVSRWLIRVAVGAEPADVLIDRFSSAFDAIHLC